MSTTNLIGSLLAASSIVMIPIMIASIAMIIGMWKVFTKANQPGWAAIVPVYNLVILFKIAGLNPLFVLGFLASVIPVIGSLLSLGLIIYLLI